MDLMMRLVYLASNKGNNPFIGLKDMFNAYKGPIQATCYTAATIALLVVAGCLMFAGAQTREKLKKKLVWIFAGIFLVYGTGYAVDLTNNVREDYFKDNAVTSKVNVNQHGKVILKIPEDT